MKNRGKSRCFFEKGATIMRQNRVGKQQNKMEC